MTTQLTPVAIANMAQHRSPEFIAAYITLRKTNFETGVSQLPFEMDRTPERHKLISIRAKHREASRVKHVEELKLNKNKAMQNFFKIAKRTKKVAAFRSKFVLMQEWENYTANFSASDFRDLAELTNYTSHCLSIGSRMKNLVQYYPPYTLKKKEEIPLHLEYALYSCSGELEADRMNTSRLFKIARNGGSNHGTHYLWRHSRHLNFARDGGGQAEVQFHIRPELARVVCGLVSQIGRINRNGGHIHLNCQMDEQIGERVFNSLRYHLSWTRWLVSYARRDHNWSSVSTTANTFQEAKRVKACAVSCNTWTRTGTVEMRIWGTTDKPDEWLGRRDLMQAIAKWSETHDPVATGIKPINLATGAEAWPAFFHWAARNAPTGLSYALKTFRKKIRSTATASLDRTNCTQMMQQWEAAGLTCKGYRCRTRCTAPVQ